LSVCEAVACRLDQLYSHLVVWLIPADCILYVEVKRVTPINITIDAGGLRVHLVEVAEKHGPFVNKLRRADQRIDLCVTFGWISVEHERNDITSRRNSAGQVERNAPQEFDIRRNRRRLNARGRHAVEDGIINEVFARNGRGVK